MSIVNKRGYDFFLWLSSIVSLVLLPIYKERQVSNSRFSCIFKEKWTLLEFTHEENEKSQWFTIFELINTQKLGKKWMNRPGKNKHS